ncbi:uncharacterized protein LOC126974524 isoform X2 [Leptidea sinapis]|uniref:uncharacterized protein LOC126974524 isoform X2 n=1 Tax=Leptidea sinapis TaxID=189913 RepID=UPI0021C46953|nr:uncharacterized protein LOC126974524 isoform X2 [Leptidea sinapis]
MATVKDSTEVTEEKSSRQAKIDQRELTDLPPSGTSLHRRRRGEPPATLSVKSPQTPSDAEGSSPCTGPTPEDWVFDGDTTDPENFCDRMLQKLKNKNDLTSNRTRKLASQTKETLEELDQLEKLLELLNQFVSLKHQNDRLLKKLQDVEHMKRLHNAYKKIIQENEKLKDESKELEQINEALDAELECDYGQALFDSMLTGGRSMKRSGSKWKTHGKFGGSLLRKQRSRSAGGEDDLLLSSPLRRRSDCLFSKDVEKSKISNWTRVKSAFKWEKAHWPASTIGGAAAVAAGAMVGAVALAGSSPASGLANNEHDSASLTPISAMSMTPNSSCEELRLDAGPSRKSISMRMDDQDHNYLQPPTQDDSSTSPSPNKLMKSPWGKMRDIIQTHRDSVKKKGRTAKSPDIVLTRRKSFSDGGESDAPPALTLTIPSSEELESEGSHHILRKQRSLELGARPPQRPRDSKWSRVKRAFLTSASASMPSSPNRHSAFFTDAETEGVSSGCEASAVYEEIARDYAALQTRLGREFSDRRGKLNIHHAKLPSRPVATEDELSADFHKKLTEWRMKGQHGKQPPPVPARQDLSDDFLKKWDEWQRMKETNSVPAWEDHAKPDEVRVQTSTGLFKFHGISRSFTRKLHEWEKSRGIAPEASTSALLRAARAAPGPNLPALTRTQSDGSVGPVGGVSRVHVSSLSVNDADDLDAELERERLLEATDECDGKKPREAVLVEVEAEEICTAAPLVAVSPRHTPQKPVYTYDQAEPRLLCETSAAITGTAVLQPNGADIHTATSSYSTGAKVKSTREQIKTTEKSMRRRISRQTSLEEDAKFIRQTIKEIERGSRYKESASSDKEKDSVVEIEPNYSYFNTKGTKQLDSLKENKNGKDNDGLKEEKRKEFDKGNGKKKSKSRARLERQQSKPSESDTEPDIDTVTVEIPRRKKRTRRPSERPRTPPTSIHSDSEGEDNFRYLF